MMVYIAYPYGKRHHLTFAEYQANVDASAKVAAEVVRKGHIVDRGYRSMV